MTTDAYDRDWLYADCTSNTQQGICNMHRNMNGLVESEMVIVREKTSVIHYLTDKEIDDSVTS